MVKKQSGDSKASRWQGAMLFHGWLGVTLWLTFGLLLESLMAYKTAAYLGDATRRELFRLAHAHGTLLHVLLIVAALSGSREYIQIPRSARAALRIGVLTLPIGFLLAGMWHPEGDPGIAIWLVPAGALLVIFGGFATALASREAAGKADRKEEKKID
jgi:hypothetical protein